MIRDSQSLLIALRVKNGWLQSNKESGPPVIEVRRKPKRVPANIPYTSVGGRIAGNQPNSQKAKRAKSSALLLQLSRHRNKLWRPTSW